MKLLHTSDWHVGATIRGNSRAAEHRQVLAEIAGIAAGHAVDLVIVAGDLFETAAPSPLSEQIVYDALLALAEVAPVVVIAGNHDNPRRLKAIAPLLALGRISLLAEPAAPDDGGLLELRTSDDTLVRLALLPFVSQRSIVRADQLMSGAAFENAQAYSDRMAKVIGVLTQSFDASSENAESVNIVVAHAFVQGGAPGGGERSAHLVEEYAVGAVAFPATASYVALGHLHRAQVIRGASAIHYCGSPLQLDFGEEGQSKSVNVVSLEPGLPAKVNLVPLKSGRPLRTVKGTVAQLADFAADVGDAWLRVRVAEATRPGLADEVRAILGEGVVDIRVELDDTSRPRQRRRSDGKSPAEMFKDFLAERDIEDERLLVRFNDLLSQVQAESGSAQLETAQLEIAEQLGTAQLEIAELG